MYKKYTRLACIANVAQLVEHVHGKDEVTGSIPVIGSKTVTVYIYCILCQYVDIIVISYTWHVHLAHMPCMRFRLCIL